MSTNIILEIGILLALILINGLFALSELAIVSSRRERLQPMAEDGNSGAKIALEMVQDPTPLLSTVQVGITLVGILAGAFGGARLSGPLADLLVNIPVIGPYSDSISLALVVGLITFLSVVIGELVPKRLALQNPERVAALVAKPMSILSRIARPVVRLLTLTTNGVLRLLGISDHADASAVTEEEIKVLVEQGAQAGIFEEAERELVESIFRFGDRQLRTIMTPRTEIVWLDVNADEETVRDIVREFDHSRFPVGDGSLDRLIGVVLAKDLLAHSWANEPLNIRNISQPPLFLPETMLALRALERFKQTGIQVAFLVDEFGGVDGMVTLFDMMEAIVGDIPTMEELSEPPIVYREDGSWLVEGYLALDDLRELLEVDELPDEEDYQTLGGFMVVQIGRLPRAGDYFDWDRFRFEVIDMDGNRVDKVLIQQPSRF